MGMSFSEKREAERAAMTPEQRVTYLEGLILNWAAAPEGDRLTAGYICLKGEASRIKHGPLVVARTRFA